MKHFLTIFLLAAYFSHGCADFHAGCPASCQDEIWERIPCDATTPEPGAITPGPIVTLPTVLPPIIYRAKKQQGKPPGSPLSGEEETSDERQTRTVSSRSNEKADKIQSSSQLEATSSEESRRAYKNTPPTYKTRPQIATTASQHIPPTRPTKYMRSETVPMLHSHSHGEEHVGAAYKYPAYHAAAPTYPTHRQLQPPTARYPDPAQQTFTNDDLAALLQAETYGGSDFKRGGGNMQAYINPTVSTTYQAPQRAMVMESPGAAMAPTSFTELANYARQMPYLNTNRISPLTRRGASLGSNSAAMLSGGGFVNPNEKPVFSLDIDGDVGNILSVQQASRSSGAASKY